ncbi:MAG: rod shape-determining protein MreD [Lachnospiraceae bacterium]|nr:rod shape-determining protein MreD [Lachnospiraceae bacterium]
MKRGVAYLLLILAFFLAQNNIFAASSLIITVPNLLLILVFSIGFMRGSFEGMLIGFVCGLLTDLFFGSTIGLSALIFAVLGYGIGMLGQIYYTEYVSLPLLLCVASDLMYLLGIYLFAILLAGGRGFGSYLVNIVLPEMLYTGLMAVVLYPLLKRTEKLIDRWEKKKTKNYV